MANTNTTLRQAINLSFLLLCLAFSSCEGQNKSKNTTNNQPEQKTIETVTPSLGNPATEIDKNIRSIYQDKKGNYWFGTNNAGIYRYDGVKLTQFTDKDGLSNNQVQSIQEDQFGNIWLGTGLFGVCRFNGQTFTTFSNHLNNSTTNIWQSEPNDLWFYAGAGAYRFSNNTLTYLTLTNTAYNSNDQKNSPYKLSAHAVYTILKDKKGNLWFGTQSQGVCRFDGKSLTWFTEKGLKGPAVLALFEDSKGNISFGNNGAGLFRYDGKELINFTEEKGLGNADFRATGKSGLNNIARIYAINEDHNGTLWIGTVDAGVWSYDGKKLTNYTTKDGLTSNAVNTIYKDKNGELWFGTDENGICKFNGHTFTEFTIPR